MSVASDKQIGGNHYVELAVQPWDALEAWLTPLEWRGYLKGSAIAYLARDGVKDGDQLMDIQKAQHYLEKLVESYKSPID